MEKILLEKCLKLQKQFDDINQKLGFEEVLIDRVLCVKLEKQKKVLEPILSLFEDIKILELENKDLENSSETNEKMYEENQNKINILCQKLNFQISKIDAKKQMVTIELQAKSASAQKLCFDVFTAYKNFCKNNDLEFAVVSSNFIGQNLLIGAEINIFGDNAFDVFVKENGIHKEEGTKNFIQVFAYEYVEPMQTEISESDLKIDIYRSNGAGGQNVNKVSTAVRITHLPTGLVATCQDERSQFQNKERALQHLKEKLELKAKQNKKKNKDSFRKKHQTTNIKRTYNYKDDVVKDVSKNTTAKLSDFIAGNLMI